MGADVRYLTDTGTGERRVVRPRPGEPTSGWMERHIRFCGPNKSWAIRFEHESLIEEGFILVEDLDEQYRALIPRD
jgi:phage baseplate assembly protein gpV